MNVYKIVMEEDNHGEIINFIQYVQAHNFNSVSIWANNHAKELDYELKQVAYVLTVVQTINKNEKG